MSFADRNRAHDSLHHLIAIGEPLNLELVPDISCLICYPIEEDFEHPLCHNFLLDIFSSQQPFYQFK